MRISPRILLRERARGVGGISSRLWIWLPATEQRRFLLPVLSMLLASLACAQPLQLQLQLQPTTDASLTDAAAWSEPGAAAAGCGGSQAPATCAAARAIPVHDDVDSVCEEHGVLPLDPEAAARGRVVVDCFMFNNELDMLLVRLVELSPVVDYFVLVEANVSHSGLYKPALFLH